ncbi:hypothetical protein GCM10007874_28840 [Labrys miyagiensis]|uniref:DUF6894 domain-containing protein n=2 Tax=Labrys miyagiensis TaxID=346912 RepID=A0ABQ6CJR5_9HYPH|nr:hypothetical protein GCM10007874_28840 [Labrys miyagiensis]
MARFFFHVQESGRRIEDLEGTEVQDLAAAKRLGLAALCELITEQVKDRKLECGGRIEIEDEDGKVLLDLCAQCAITIMPPSDAQERRCP